MKKHPLFLAFALVVVALTTTLLGAMTGLHREFGVVGASCSFALLGSCLIDDDISQDDCESLESGGGGGVQQVWIANVKDLVGVPTRDSDGYVTNITLRSGARLYRLTPQEDSAGHSFTYVPASDPAGASKDARFEFRFNVTTPKLSTLLDRLFIGRVVIITLENDGNYYITIGAGLRGSEGGEGSGLTSDNPRSRNIVLSASRLRFRDVRQFFLAGSGAIDARKATTAALLETLTGGTFAFTVTQPTSTTVSKATGNANVTLTITRGTLTSGVITAEAVPGTLLAGMTVAPVNSTLTGTSIVVNVVVTAPTPTGAATIRLRLFSGVNQDFVEVPLNITA